VVFNRCSISTKRLKVCQHKIPHHYSTSSPNHWPRQDGPMILPKFTQILSPFQTILSELEEMFKCENPTRSAVSEILRPARLAPTPYHIQSHLNHLNSSFWCSVSTSADRLDHVYMPKCTELLQCDWLFRNVCVNEQLNRCS